MSDAPRTVDYWAARARAAEAENARLREAAAPILTYLEASLRISGPINDLVAKVNDIELRKSHVAALRAAVGGDVVGRFLVASLLTRSMDVNDARLRSADGRNQGT